MIFSKKLQLPRLPPSVIKRDKLMHHLNQGLKFKSTLIIAQAGYGKTTALTEWIQQAEVQIIWISLDRNDNNFITFWSCAIEGMERQRPDIAKRLSPILAASLSKAVEPFVSALLQELHGILEEWVIIFDDFHTIEENLIHQSLALVLEHLPSQIHLYFSSRSELPFATSRLIAQNELHRIDVHSLRFQIEEGIQFFQLRTQLSLNREDVSLLVNHAEGWVSGLQLAAISLEKNKNSVQFIRDFSGKHHDIADYLMEEVFQQQSAEMRDFLLKTSILSELNSELCEAVTLQNGCQNTLEKLEKLNLFIIPLDDYRVSYRYHHLFADFLQHYFQQQQPRQWVEAQAAAAKWLQTNSFHEKAVDHFLAGHHYTDAVQIIEHLLPETNKVKWNVMHRWLSILPETVIDEKPIIEIYYIVALVSIGEWEIALKRIKHAELHFLAVNDVLKDAEWKRWGSILFLVGATTYYGLKDFVRSQEYLVMFDKLIPESDPFHTLSANSSISNDQEDILAYINDLSVAESFIKQRVEAWGNKRDFPLVGYFLIAYSELLYEWNRLEEAAVYAERALERKDMQPLARILVYAASVASRVHHAEGNTEQAIKLLKQMKLRINSPDQAVFIMKIEAQEICLSLQQPVHGSTGFVLQWLETCGMHYTDPINIYMLTEYLTLARVLANDGQAEQAMQLLGRMYLVLSKDDRLRGKIRVLIVQSIILHRQEDMQEAWTKLAEALYLAEPQGYIRSFVDEGNTMIEMLSTYLELQQNSNTRNSIRASLDYVKQLLHILIADTDAEQRMNITLLTEQEARIIKLLDRGLTNKEIGEHIYVTVETVKTHLKNVYRKLNVTSRSEALQRVKELSH